jgi:hypothetical protein
MNLLTRCGERLDAPELPIRPFPWWTVHAGALFMGLLREMLEMRCRWKEPARLSNAKLVELPGEEPHTPLHATFSRLCLAPPDSLNCINPQND